MKKLVFVLLALAICVMAGLFIMKGVYRTGWELVSDSGSIHMIQGTAEDMVFTLTHKGTPSSGKSLRFEANSKFSGLPSEPLHSDANGKIYLPDLTVLSSHDETLTAVLGNGAKIVTPVKVTFVSYSLVVTSGKLTQYKSGDVSLKLKANGRAASKGTKVFFAADSVFSNLPAEAQVRESNGQILLTGVTARASGNQELEVTVNGSHIKVAMDIRPATYALVMNNQHVLPIGTEQAIEVAFFRNGKPLSGKGGANVSITYEGPGEFFSPPETAQLSDAGSFTLNLTGKTAGEGTITTTLEEDYGPVALSFVLPIEEPTYAMSLFTSHLSASSTSQADGAGGTPGGVSGQTGVFTARVTNHNVPAPGQTVDFKWKVKGGKQAWQDGGTLVTDSEGKAVYTLQSDDSKTILVKATLQSDPTGTATGEVQYGKALSRGFLAAASNLMNWEDAKAYCESQGGKLPMVHRSVPCDGTVISIEGFGVGAWPSSSLFPGCYWTMLETCHPKGSSWIVCPQKKRIGVIFDKQTSPNRVACVP